MMLAKITLYTEKYITYSKVSILLLIQIIINITPILPKNGSTSNNVGDNLNQQNLLNYVAAPI